MQKQLSYDIRKFVANLLNSKVQKARERALKILLDVTKILQTLIKSGMIPFHLKNSFSIYYDSKVCIICISALVLVPILNFKKIARLYNLESNSLKLHYINQTSLEKSIKKLCCQVSFRFYFRIQLLIFISWKTNLIYFFMTLTPEQFRLFKI